MSQSLQPYQSWDADGAVSVGQRNRVLRNTYWLLALSMVPTVLGAWLRPEVIASIEHLVIDQ